MYRIFFLSFCLVSTTLIGQSGIQSLVDARSIAMGRTASVDQGSSSLFTNPAGLASLEDFSVVVAAENRFLVSELQSTGLALGLPTASGTFGLKAGRFGFEAYNETQLSLLYSRKLAPGFQLGAEVIYWNTSIPEYGNRSFLTFALGIQGELSKQIQVGAFLYNPLRLKVTEDEASYALLQIGLAYRPTDIVTLVAEVEKDVDFPARFKAGIEYQVSDPFSIRVGIGTAPSTISFGFGLKVLPGVQLDIAASRHEILGFTPGISLVYTANQ